MLNFCIIRIKFNFSDWILLCFCVLYFIYGRPPSHRSDVFLKMCPHSGIPLSSPHSHVIEMCSYRNFCVHNWSKTLLYPSGYWYIPKENFIVTISHSSVSPEFMCVWNLNFLTRNPFCKNIVLPEFVVILHWLYKKC